MMKNPIEKILLFVLLGIGLVLLNSSCKKDTKDVDEPVIDNPIISTTGEATVGKAGAIISVGDASSVIYGANINIPKDAVDEDIIIKIVPGPEQSINGEMVQTVELLPEGTKFKKNVVLGIPWTSDNQSNENSKVYYFNPETFLMEELITERVDTEKKITYAYINHFSRVFNRRQMFLFQCEMMKKGTKIIGNLKLMTPLSQILTPDYLNQGYANAEEIVENNTQDCFVRFHFRLIKYLDDDSEEIVATQKFYVKHSQSSGVWNVKIYKEDGWWLSYNHPVEIFSKTGLSFSNLQDVWFSGIPIIAQFNQECFHDDWFTYTDSDLFDIAVSWSIRKEMEYDADAWTYMPAMRTNFRKSLSTLETYTGDNDNNNITDIYEGNNYPPSQPGSPSPATYATNVSLDTELQWYCSDVGELLYDVYFGTDPNPPFIENVSESIYTPTSLDANTTYYWYIEAFDSDGLSTVGPVWEFTTEAGGSGSACNGISSIDYEGQTYHTVEIGEQCWLKENLNVGTRIDGTEQMSDNNTIEKYCYNDDVDKCNIYGGLYQWDEIMQYTTQQGTQGICPDDWHIPTDDDFSALITTLGGFSNAGGKMKETGTAHWNSPNEGATNESNFTALPSGYNNGYGSFWEIGNFSAWWTSSDLGSSSPRTWYILHDKSSIYQGSEQKRMAYSIRCIKD